MPELSPAGSPVRSSSSAGPSFHSPAGSPIRSTAAAYSPPAKKAQPSKTTLGHRIYEVLPNERVRLKQSTATGPYQLHPVSSFSQLITLEGSKPITSKKTPFTAPICLKFLLTNDYQLWFAPDYNEKDQTVGIVPPHYLITEQHVDTAQCLSAGNIYLEYRGEQFAITTVNHKSGNFRPQFESLKLVMALLTSDMLDNKVRLAPTVTIQQLDINGGIKSNNNWKESEINTFVRKEVPVTAFDNAMVHLLRANSGLTAKAVKKPSFPIDLLPLSEKKRLIRRKRSSRARSAHNASRNLAAFLRNATTEPSPSTEAAASGQKKKVRRPSFGKWTEPVNVSPARKTATVVSLAAISSSSLFARPVGPTTPVPPAALSRSDLFAGQLDFDATSTGQDSLCNLAAKYLESSLFS